MCSITNLSATSLMAALFATPFYHAPAEQANTIEEKARLLNELIEVKVNAVLASRDETERRAKRVTVQEGAAELGITERHLLRLLDRGEVKGTRAPGTRRYYFVLGDLLDWAKESTREDGGLRYTTRKSAAGAKREKGQATV
jgi:hypothetical protein